MEEKKYNKRIYSPTHKMGFKLLSDTQLKNIFPTVDNLEKKFETHRKNISKIGEIREQDIHFDFQYNLMYDSIFSIWGKRGSGKTSALFTLKYRLEEKYPNDFVLPVIMPEMIPADCDIIGWILAILDKEVKKLEDRIEDNPKLIHDNEFFRHCAFDANNNSLRVSYKKVKELASSRSAAYIREDGSYAENIGNTERYTQNGFDFAKKLMEFWDILVKSIKKVCNMKKGEEPLIYIMFDDVDLTPDRVVELFSVIIKYLSHPNVVVITTADEELFRDVIESDLGKKIKKDMLSANLNKIAMAMVSQWDNYNQIREYVQRDTVLDQQVKETAKLYIDKVLPPSERYYLELFDTCEKRRGFIESTDIEGRNTTLEQFICKQIERLYTKIWDNKDSASGKNNFLYYEKNSQKYFMTSYLLFMGNTSRQLANQCFILQELVDALLEIYRSVDNVDDEEQKYVYLHRQVYRQIQHFLYNSINAGSIAHLEGINTGILVEKLLLFQKEQFPIYINYSYLLEYYRERSELSQENENRISVLKDTVSLFMLLFLAENILFIADSATDSKYAVNSGRKRIHGTDNFVELFDEITLNNDWSLIKRSEDRNDKNALKEILYLFEYVIIYPDKIVNFDINNFNSIREYLYNLSERQLINNVTKDMLQKWSHRNPKWFKTISEILYLSYEGVYTLHFKELKRIDLKREYLGNHKFVRNWIRNINLMDGTHLLKIILRLEEENQYLYNEFSGIINNISKWTDKDMRTVSIMRRTFSKLCELKGETYVDAFDIEENFQNIMIERYGEKCVLNNEKTLDMKFIASLGLRTVLKSEGYQEWRKILFNFGSDDISYKYLKNWLEVIIDELQKRIYDMTRAEISYAVSNVGNFKNAVSRLYNLENVYGSGNVQNYKNIIEYCNDKEMEILPINAHLVMSLLQQINRTVKQFSRIEYERVNINVLDEMESCLVEINKNLLLAAYTAKYYEKIEEYVLLFYTLNYFTDLFYALLIYEEKAQIGFKLDGHSIYEEDSFGMQMYKEMLSVLNGKNPKNQKKSKNARKQYYYLSELLRTYFIEAGDMYIKQWRSELDE